MRFRLFAFAFLALVGVAVSATLEFQPQAAPQPRTWRVEVVPGPAELLDLGKATVNIDATHLRMQGEKGIGVIPVKEVTRLIYFTTPNWASESLDEFRPTGEGYLFGAAWDVSRALTLLAFKGDQHFVGIAWHDSGSDRQISLKLAKQEYSSLVQELERATGLRHRNLPAEKEQMEKDLEAAKKNPAGIELSQETWLGGVRLKPDLYQVVVVLSRSPSGATQDGSVFLYRGKKTKSVVATASAKIEPALSGAGARPQFLPGGPQRLAAVVAQDRKMTIAGPHLIPGNWISREKGKWLMKVVVEEKVSRIEYFPYDGEPAFRFMIQHVHPVNDLEGNPDCRGHLYVTPTRIAYDPKFSADNASHGFVSTRQQVREASFRRINLSTRPFDFDPIFAKGDKLSRVHRVEVEGRRYPMNPRDWFKPFFDLTWNHFAAVEAEFQSLGKD